MTILEEAIKDIDISETVISFKEFGDAIGRHARIHEYALEPIELQSYSPGAIMNYRTNYNICNFEQSRFGYYKTNLMAQLDQNKEIRLVKINFIYSTIVLFEDASIEIWYKGDDFSPNNICKINVYKNGDQLAEYYANTDDAFINGLDRESETMLWYYSCPALSKSKLENIILAGLKVVGDYYNKMLNN
jgi:hypothetical protein